ncbi:leucine rich repeat and Ig domain containing 3 precursor [Silurus meridionalis]|nr:leucine rich repeat and Ig domain containing 3 precursor [Silurus meridionalis]
MSLSEVENPWKGISLNRCIVLAIAIVVLISGVEMVQVGADLGAELAELLHLDLALVLGEGRGILSTDPNWVKKKKGMAVYPDLGLLVLLLLQITAPVCHSQGCPQVCNCVHQRKSVNCQNKYLNSFPNGIPTDTRFLDLSRNKLRWVEHSDLEAYKHLEDLDLSENLISVLEPNAFSSLLKLRVLRLRANHLKLVPMGAFSHLANLTVLDLSGNKLVILVDFTFQDLQRLQKLEVGDNDLVYISNKAFLGLTGLRELTIERCNLTSISGQALSYLRGLVSLRLRYLNIASFEEQTFHKLGGLRGLEIDHWPFLEYISPYSFQGLNLSWLFITNTNITTVPTGALRNLVHLGSLNLSHNPISVLESWALRDLVNLKDLHLVGTQLMCVQPYGLGGLQQIRLLNLSNNRLVTLEEGSFQSVNTLEMLRVDGNPLFCDCRLLWVLQRRKTLNFDGKYPVCAGPVEVQGKALGAFSDSALLEHFTCQRPKIRNRKLQQLSAREGQAASFFCQADGEPTPTIFWISPQRRRITTRSTGRLIVLPEGTLKIHFVQVTDSGTYICIASNAGGNDTYFATLTVSGVALDAGLLVNRTYSGDLNDTNLNDTHVFLKFTLDLKTILISTAMGCITFLGVVIFCFLLLFVWSRGRGQHKNNFSVEYSFRKVDGPAASGGQGGARKFNMKMI